MSPYPAPADSFNWRWLALRTRSLSMICNRAGSVVHGYFDSELDAVGAAEFERHLENCSDCVFVLEDLESLRSSMDLAQLYERAPTLLRKKFVASLGSERPVAAVPSDTVWRRLAVAAAFLLIAYASWRVTPVGRSSSYERVLAAEIVDAHLRSLQPGHLTDVISTDQHAVKPWFDGKLDFSHGRSVAALVYVRRKHSLIPKVAAFQIRLVSLRIHNLGAFQRGLFLRIQIDPDLLRDGSRHLILQRQSILQLALIALGPKVLVRSSINQLCGDAHLVARAKHRSFHDAVHVQLTSNLRQRLACMFICHHRGARDHPQRADLAQI